ncbi:MAG: hypothetical protein ACR2QC_06145 [Gammaproteobacteria bacterium]
MRRGERRKSAAERRIRLSANEIPAFAGMAVFLYFRVPPNSVLSAKTKRTRHSGESRNLFAP